MRNGNKLIGMQYHASASRPKLYAIKAKRINDHIHHAMDVKHIYGIILRYCEDKISKSMASQMTAFKNYFVPDLEGDKKSSKSIFSDELNDYLLVPRNGPS